MPRKVAVIQARTGSTRLPGKVMYPLDGAPMLRHVVKRVTDANTIDNTVVATTTGLRDDVIERCASRAGARVVRGSESYVMERFARVSRQLDPDLLVRVTADCPLISPETIDAVVERTADTDADYGANIIQRTFPRGLDVEASAPESFETVRTEANQPHHREHVTPYYREQTDQFDLISVTSDEVFDESWMQDRTDLRLTVDEADDYELLWEIYDRLEYDEILPIKEAVKLVDQEDLHELNANVRQKHLRDASDNQS
jgi:spore coat polysaccharide biosynthesis protein SpsF